MRQTPQFIEPMKARLVESPPPGEWTYEIKFDGFRALALKHGKKVQLLSRNQKDLAAKFPDVSQAVSAMQVADAILDGEIVALDSEGRSSFQLLQAFELREKRPPIFFYVFDLVRLDGRDLKNQPLEQRKSLLEKVLQKAPRVIRFSSSLGGEARELLKRAEAMGLEGLVGKRVGSLYESGRRSGAWIKLKVQRQQEFVIGGYTKPGGTRKYFGSVLVGFYENRNLKFCGKVGTGFNTALLRDLHTKFQTIARKDCPFVNLPEQRAGRFGAGVTNAAMKRCLWVKPKLVCEVKFSEWTRDGKLRQPVFLGLRTDKQPREVARERPD